MLNLIIGRDGKGTARVAGFTFIPLYVHWTAENIRVLALSDGLAPGAVKLYGLSDYDLERLSALDQFVPSQLTRYLGAAAARKDGSSWVVEFPE
jgi:hypothetical protein